MSRGAWTRLAHSKLPSQMIVCLSLPISRPHISQAGRNLCLMLCITSSTSVPVTNVTQAVVTDFTLCLSPCREVELALCLPIFMHLGSPATARPRPSESRSDIYKSQPWSRCTPYPSRSRFPRYPSLIILALQMSTSTYPPTNLAGPEFPAGECNRPGEAEVGLMVVGTRRADRKATLFCSI